MFSGTPALWDNSKRQNSLHGVLSVYEPSPDAMGFNKILEIKVLWARNSCDDGRSDRKVVGRISKDTH